ncbi:MAG: glycosyltransferase family 2 protein [Rikenellaceae bacterium]
MLDLSLVIPLYNEEESLGELTAWIDRVAKNEKLSYELIFIDDGSTDTSWSIIEELKKTYNEIRAVRFRRNYGKSAALYVGFEMTRGKVVMTMDADLQDSPDEIPALYSMITNDGYDLVSGWKGVRKDPIGKTLPSKFFNATARCVSGIKLHDFNCGLKAYRGKVVKSIEVYGEMHRYIPILAKQAGFKKIAEKVVEHYPRKYGVSKFGWERMIKGYIDLISVTFMTRFGRRPMYIFGGIGSLMFLIGGGITLYLIIAKLVLQGQGAAFRAVTDQPLFYLAITSLVIGVQLFLAGFIGEMINRNSSDRNRYLTDETIE